MLLQMSPHSHSSEVSVKQQFSGQQYYQPSNQSNSSKNPGQPGSGHQQPLNNPALNFNYIVGEIEDFISNTNNNTDLNRSLEEEEEDEIESSNSSMDEMIITSAGNLLDDFFLSNDPTGSIKNEAFDAQFNDMNMLNIDNSHLDYQYINYGSINNNNNQNQYHQTHQLHSMPQQQLNYEENKCSTFENISMPNQIIKNAIPCSSNLLDLNSIKQETVVDESNSSFCSSSDTMSLSYTSTVEQHKYGSSLEQPPPMSSAALASMSKQNRLNYEKRYGPIVVRPRKNPAPTLASGRKSKYTELPADEERKREIRRSRNRQAAEKCKQKRSEIEEKLEIDLKNLLNEQNSLHNEQQQLNETKQRLELIYKQHIENCAHKSNVSHAGLVYQQTAMPIAYSTQHVLSQHANLNEYSMLGNNNSNNYQYSLVVNAAPYESTSSTASSSTNANSSYTQHRQLNQLIQQQQQSKSINHQQSNYNYENI